MLSNVLHASRGWRWEPSSPTGLWIVSLLAMFNLDFGILLFLFLEGCRSVVVLTPLHTQEGDTLSLRYMCCLGFRLGLSLPHVGDSRQPDGDEGILGAEHTCAQVAKGPRGQT